MGMGIVIFMIIVFVIAFGVTKIIKSRRNHG